MNQITQKASQGLNRVSSSPMLQPHNLNASRSVDQKRGTKTHHRSSFQHSPTNHCKWVLSTNPSQTCNLRTATSRGNSGGTKWESWLPFHCDGRSQLSTGLPLKRGGCLSTVMAAATSPRVSSSHTMGSLSYIQSLPLVCQAKAPEKEARSGKEVAVHLNGQTATSFLMAVHQNEQPPLFQALHTGSSQPPLSALHLRAGLLARHTCEALLPDSRAHISNAPTLSRVFEKRNGGLRRTPWAVGRADFLTVPVSGVQANRQQTTTLVSAGGLLVQQTAPIYATQANKQQSSILFLSAAGLRVPVSRSVHLCSFVFVSALRVVKCSRDLHRRATHLSARNTSGESLTYMRELNDSQQRCLQKFINICMVDGKKTKSHLILTNTFARLANYGDVVAFVMNAIENVKPIIEIKKVRISGSTQMVPSLISKRRQETLAIRWIVEAALQRRKAKQSFNLEQCLFAEIVDASNKVGVVRKKRDELHKLAEANRGFAHYRWW